MHKILLSFFVLISLFLFISFPSLVNAVDCSKADVAGEPRPNGPKDGIVDFSDQVSISFAFGATPSDIRYSLDKDQNNDSIIDEKDLAIVKECRLMQTGEAPSFDLPVSPTGNEFSNTGFFAEIITKILPIIFGFAGFVAVILILVSGIQFIISGGNPEAAVAARNRLTMAVLGFAIVMMAFAITQIIDTIFLGTADSVIFRVF